MKYPAHKYNSGISRELKTEMATRDATFFISVLNALPNPDPILRKTGNRIQVYRDLTADWEVFSAIELIDSGLSDLDWEIVANENSSELANFAEELVKSWDPYKIMTDCIEARGFGYQPFENIWHSYDGRWIIKEIIAKPQEWFNYDTKNRLQFISKDNPQGSLIEDNRKIIVARNRPTYLNPYGESAYSRIFWPIAFKKGGMSFWVKFLEKYGMPWVVGKQPRGTGQKETNEFLTQLHNMVQDAVSVIPDDSSVDLKDSPFRASSSGSYQNHIDYCDKVINKVILSNEMSMGTSKKGSEIRGDAAKNYEVSEKVIKKVAGFAQKAINEALEMIWAVNFEGIPPTISIYPPKEVQKDRADRDKTLTETGVKFTEKYYKDNYDLADDDFELVDPKKNQPPTPPRSAPTPPEDPEPEETPDPEEEDFSHKTGCQCGACRKAKVKNFSEKLSLEKALGLNLDKLRDVLKQKKKLDFNDALEENSMAGLEELEKLIEASAGDESAQELQDIISEQLQPMFELIEQAEDYDEVIQTLATAYPEMEVEELQDRIAKAYFIADILGRITEEENQEIEE
ncbi:phage portal protein family protein [Gracilimonas tropica]|uniref:phage portal protein family protein n=1 Tax=Gracilimonas tropica TaxID=454600 RepID=UPI0003723723|nr:DUF935 family protein [Gracilimonas tropica]